MTNPYGQQPGQPQPYGQPPSGGMPAQQPYGQPGMGQYPGQFGQPGMAQPGMGMGQEIKDYMGWAIGCIFLFWPLAIFAIIKANEVKSNLRMGNIPAAENASSTAKTMCLVSTIIGIVVHLTWILITIIAIATASTAVTYSTY